MEQDKTAMSNGPRSKRLQVLGLLQIACGTMVLLASLACVFALCWGYFLAVGMWSGAFYCIVGMVTFVGARLTSCRLALISMFLGLVSVTLTLLGVAMESVGMLSELHLRWFSNKNYTKDFILPHDKYLKNRLLGIDRRLTLHLAGVIFNSVHCLASCVQAVITFQRYHLFQNMANSKAFEAHMQTHHKQAVESVPLNNLGPFHQGLHQLQSVEEDMLMPEDYNEPMVLRNPLCEQQQQQQQSQPQFTPLHTYIREMSASSCSTPNSPVINNYMRRGPGPSLFNSPMRSISQQQTEPLLPRG